MSNLLQLILEYNLKLEKRMEQISNKDELDPGEHSERATLNRVVGDIDNIVFEAETYKAIKEED